MAHKWTDEEIRFLEEIVPGRPRQEILKLCQEHFDWDVTLMQILGAMKNRRISSGRTGQFVKGRVSHNKGVKMPEHVYEAAKATMFQKGLLPHNTLPVGSEVVRTDGYIWVKISDTPNVPAYKNWKFKHLIIWEQAHGPVPPGHVIIFLDGDKRNFDLDNLECISRATHTRMAQLGLRSHDRDTTRTGIALAELVGVRARKQRRSHD